MQRGSSMHQITIPGSLEKQLGGLDAQALLCDAHGRALGVFIPLAKPVDANGLQLEPPLSIAQTEELRKLRTGKPLEEILERLGVALPFVSFGRRTPSSGSKIS